MAILQNNSFRNAYPIMSLSYQINLKILLFWLLMLFLGGGLVLWKARNSVDKELNASVSLAEHLISCDLSQMIPDRSTWLNCLRTLKETRHLDIELIAPAGQIFEVGNKNEINDLAESPPSWFINLIEKNRWP